MATTAVEAKQVQTMRNFFWCDYNFISKTLVLKDIDKLHVLPQLVKKFPALYKTRGPFRCSQQPIIYPCPQPDEISLRFPIRFIWSILMLSFNLYLALPSGLILSSPSDENLEAFIFSRMRATRVARLIPLALYIVILTRKVTITP